MKSQALQQAIYTRLSSQIGGSVVDIYSDVPQSALGENPAAFPYVTIDIATMRPFDTKGANGGDALVDIGLWSRSHSKLTDRAIVDAIYDALQKYDGLSISGVTVIDCRFNNGLTLDDPDGKTTHYVSTFRVTYLA